MNIEKNFETIMGVTMGIIGFLGFILSGLIAREPDFDMLLMGNIGLLWLRIGVNHEGK